MDLSYEQSLRLLEETTAAVEMIKYGNSGLDFSGIDVVLVSDFVSLGQEIRIFFVIVPCLCGNIFQFTQGLFISWMLSWFFLFSFFFFLNLIIFNR